MSVAQRDVLTWIVVLISACYSLLIQSNLFLNHDVAFLAQIAIYANNTDIYSQYIEVNPPLIIYVYRLFLLLSSFDYINEISSLRISMLIYILIVLCYLFSVLKNTVLDFREFWIVTIAFSLFFVFPQSFLQRDHIITATFFMYFGSLIPRVYLLKENVLLNVIVSILTSLAICLKPQYIMILLFAELYMSIRSRSVLILFRWQSLLIFFVGLLYVSYVYIIHPTYFDFILPLAQSKYIAYFKDLYTIIAISGVVLIYTVPSYLYLAFKGVDLNVLSLMGLFIFGGGLVYIIGRTGFPYHLMLMVTFSFCVMLFSIIFSIYNVKKKVNLINVIYLFLFSIVFFSFCSAGVVKLQWPNVGDAFYNIHTNRPGKITPEYNDRNAIKLYNALDNHTEPGDGIVFYATTMFPAHSVSLHLRQEWKGKFPVLWPLPNSLNNLDNATLEMVRNNIFIEISNNKPNSIVIEESDDLYRYPKGFSFIEFLKKKEILDMELSKYKVIERIPYGDSIFVIYKRIRL